MSAPESFLRQGSRQVSTCVYVVLAMVRQGLEVLLDMEHAEDGDIPLAGVNRLQIVGVMGSGTQTHSDRATALGLWLATQNVHLLTGGGGGVMESVSRAFHSVNERRGKIIGILPGTVDGDKYRPMPGYPNSWIEIPIRTHLPLSGPQGTDLASRNHINILSSDVLVALPGSQGTASEVRLALQYEKPLVAFLSGREDIPELPREAHVEPDFEKVKDFVRLHIL